MLVNIFTGKPFLTKAQNRTGYYRFSANTKAEKSKVIKGVNVEYYDPAKDSEKFHSYDFALDNLEAIGALGKLQPVVMSCMSDMTFADHFQNINISKPE